MDHDGGYFVPVAAMLGQVYARTEPTSNDTGINGGYFSSAKWSVVYASGGIGNATAGNPFCSTLQYPGQGILKDLGRTVVSANRTFRKIQLVVNTKINPSTFSTFGVNGAALGGSTLVEDYLTGYIEIGFEGQGTPAPVAHFGR
jgi:hypothetical protein